MNEIHDANRRGWDAAAKAGLADFRCDIDWRECHRNSGLVLDERELKWLGGLPGKKACVLGSGDNRVVFALLGLGAQVTSVDISEGQLDVARQRAAQLGLQVRFLRADVTDLSAIESDTFDLVYTGGHVAVWVSDLRKYYAEAARILRPGGLFLVNEYHPFRRIWDEKASHLRVRSSYFGLGPDRYDRAEGMPGAETGSLPAYEFHWTISQYLMAVLDAGCELLVVDEFGDRPEAHEEGPSLAGLPQCLLIVARKRECPAAAGSG